MHGLMMDRPLLISALARHAERNFPAREIVSVTADNPRHRYTYAECFARAKQLANALEKLGLERGDRVATLCWNDYRHLEAYYGISGAGFVCHTINPRLFPEQQVFIINHAEDRWIMTDVMFVPLLEKLVDKINGVKGFIVMTDEAHMPETSLENVLCYETLIGAEAPDYDWPDLDERSASALCYTSGTTGDPKGVLYDHRSTILHAYAAVAPDVMGMTNRDCVLPIVPLFHVNAWGSPYTAVMVGAKLVLPGPKMGDGETLCELFETEHVTISLGVPTVWLAVLAYAEQAGKKLETVERAIIGGAAVPRAMIQKLKERHGIEVRQGWGMTETSPLGVTNTIKAGMEDLDDEARLDLAVRAGRGLFGIEMRIVDDDGAELPWDGEAFGALQVRGPWVCRDYFKLDGAAGTHTADGWFETGDVATIDPQGYMAITDRTKDVIKSGGEWISSIELENLAMGHPAVAEAAVIGVAHPKWTERPLLVVVTADGRDVGKEELLALYEGKVASWWIPDDVAFVDELPHTATGKVKKIELRRRFADYRLPD
ncbi:MAG: 3-(methylthio)propionyl-CoA ligase [Woeseiaceae bacterium]|nr:3-(methylthio)propionyl-CoA ligase [Woeseiaceae bacterium]